jgi:hypothetical protein
VFEVWFELAYAHTDACHETFAQNVPLLMCAMLTVVPTHDELWAPQAVGRGGSTGAIITSHASHCWHVLLGWSQSVIDHFTQQVHRRWVSYTG